LAKTDGRREAVRLDLVMKKLRTYINIGNHMPAVMRTRGIEPGRAASREGKYMTRGRNLERRQGDEKGVSNYTRKKAKHDAGDQE